MKTIRDACTLLGCVILLAELNLTREAVSHFSTIDICIRGYIRLEYTTNGFSLQACVAVKQNLFDQYIKIYLISGKIRISKA